MQPAVTVGVLLLLICVAVGGASARPSSFHGVKAAVNAAKAAHTAAAGSASDKKASVLCRAAGTTGYTCAVQAFEATPWSARASLVDSTINTTGWGSLVVEGNGEVAVELAAYGSGFVEGYLTYDLIDLAWLGNPVTASAKAQQFIKDNVAWIGEQVKSQGATDAYWHEVGLVYLQEQGLNDGYVLGSNNKPALTAEQIMYMALQVEVGDIEQSVVDVSSRLDWSSLSDEEFARKSITASHCSAIFKVTANFSEVYASHDTWSSYTTMLRLFKTYATTPASSRKTADLIFSSYPGSLASIDDFYLTSQNIVAIETTNNVFNASLYDYITTQTVPYWARVTVASRVATTAQSWHETFYRFNSGTYNNQWMTLDYKLFSPGQLLAPGLFWVSEQLPGHFHSEDQTMVLQRGYWPSYNVPFYEDIYTLSGYPEQVKRRGPSSSYQLAPRASLFRKHAGAVDTLEDLKGFMLLNTYGTGDPLAPNPFAAIASRGDLSGLEAFGAIDSKITSYALAKAGSALAISGPTHTQHPPFSWTGGFASQKEFPHYGQPTTFNFDWVTFSLPAVSNASHV